MTIAPANASAVVDGTYNSGSSFSLTPKGAGNFILLEINCVSATVKATSVAASNSNVTWTQLVAPTQLTANGIWSTVFIGQVNSVSAGTQTVTFSGSAPTVRGSWKEFTTTVGFSSVTLDSSGTVNVASNGSMPPVTPTRAGDLYWAYVYNSVNGVNGNTSGFTYALDANNNQMCWQAGCANAVQHPNIGDTNGTSGIGVMVYELPPTTPTTQGDTAAAADAAAVSAAVPAADTAAAADAVQVSSPVPAGDTAAAADKLAVAVTAPLADAAAAADLGGNSTPVPGDAAAAGDKAAVAAAVPQPDAAAAADHVAVGIPANDGAAAAESLRYLVGLAPADSAAAYDVLGVVGPGSGPRGFGSTLPQAVLSAYTPPGYAGGPSGAAAVPASALGNGWEIYVYDSVSFTTLLAVIPASMLMSFQFARMLDDIGSGTVVLSQDDPWWHAVTLPGGLPTETLLDEECLWQVYKDGEPRFEFFGETVTEQLVAGSEQRQVTVTGPGTISALKRAMVAPQGFPDIVLKLDGLLDAFDEVDVNGNPVIDTNIWTTLSPAGSVYITPIAVLYNYPTGAGYALSSLYPSGSMTLAATPGGTLLGASPYDATDTLISAQVTPVGVTATATDSTTPAAYGTGLDGSELTQFYVQSNFNSGNYALIGLSGSAFYAALGSGGSQQTKVLPAYDSQAHANWMITEQGGSGGTPGTFYFWTSPDGQQWTLQWQAVHSWDATNVTFFVSAAYSAAGQSVVLSNLNSNVTTPSYQGSIYLGTPMMGVWMDQFGKAKARGTIPYVTTTASAAADSYGRAWTDTQNVQAVNGTDLYTFLQGALAVVDADYVMDPGFQLRVGMPAAGQVALGVDRSDYLIFREGYDVQSKQRVRARDQIATLIGGENSDGHEITAFSASAIAQWGQREGWFQTAAQVDPASMAYATAASLGQREDEVVSWQFQLLPNVPGKTVFDNFDVGDWVGLERPDFSAVDAVRVVGIAVAVDSSGAEQHELTFMSYIQWLGEQLTYIANKLGGSFVNTQGTTPVAPSKYGTGQVPTYFTPAATLAGLADVAGGSGGSTLASAPLVYNPATGQYQHAGTTDPVSGQVLPVTVASPAGSATVSATSVTVLTGNGSATVGLQGDGTVAVVNAGGAAPSVPDVPAVSGVVQGLVVSWDGLLSGAQPLSSFSYVGVYVGTSSGFTPSPASQAGTLAKAGALTVGNLTAGVAYYVKLVAYSNANVASAATTAVTATATAVPTALLTGQLPASLLGNSAGNALNPNPYFNGGDLTGWLVVNGSVAALAPPSGAPGGAQYAAKVTSTAANCLLTGSPDPFPVTPGQPYAMTAWAYNPGSSPVSVAAGFNWTSGTTTVSVAPNTWVPLTTVQTAPAGVTSAYQVIGPAASGVVLWVLGAVAVGQVPGQLIAAQSVAAQQIAANTITASQLAANTITAAQIAAATITAAQIAANTITAAQIAAGTITAAQIASGTITAANIASGTITAANIASGTVVAGIVDSTTITSATITASTINGTTINASTLNAATINSPSISGSSMSISNSVGTWDNSGINTTGVVQCSQISIGGTTGTASLEASSIHCGALIEADGGFATPGSLFNVTSGGAIAAASLHTSGIVRADGGMITNGTAWPQSTISTVSASPNPPTQAWGNTVAAAINGLISRLQTAGLIS